MSNIDNVLYKHRDIRFRTCMGALCKRLQLIPDPADVIERNVHNPDLSNWVQYLLSVLKSEIR